jgi:redox-sensitive bicupin YhaK (pirin superfamily)
MNAITHLSIKPHLHDLGDGFFVRRMLPSLLKRMVGPFVFFDHIGPVDMRPGVGVDVRPHPHIGLSTMTYLFDGVFTHRDSLGVVQDIRPGAVNWMTAGRGVTHSERTPEAERAAGHRMHGVQFWVGLPQADAELAPEFTHVVADDLPQWSENGASFRLVAGSAFGRESDVPTYSRMFCADIALAADTEFVIPTEHIERALQVVDGEVEVDGEILPMHGMLVLTEGSEVRVRATQNARVMLFGGDPLDGPRFIWWNFVAADKERIERAKDDWKNGRFAAVPNESEFIPLPDK